CVTGVESRPRERSHLRITPCSLLYTSNVPCRLSHPVFYSAYVAAPVFCPACRRIPNQLHISCRTRACSRLARVPRSVCMEPPVAGRPRSTPRKKAVTLSEEDVAALEAAVGGEEAVTPEVEAAPAKPRRSTKA